MCHNVRLPCYENLLNKTTKKNLKKPQNHHQCCGFYPNKNRSSPFGLPFWLLKTVKCPNWMWLQIVYSVPSIDKGYQTKKSILKFQWRRTSVCPNWSNFLKMESNRTTLSVIISGRMCYFFVPFIFEWHFILPPPHWLSAYHSREKKKTNKILQKRK